MTQSASGKGLTQNANSAFWPSAAEWWRSLRWVAITFTLLVALSLAGSFVPYEQVVSKGHPWLPKRQCRGCPLCGMTRSYCATAQGRLPYAVRWNPAGPWCYGISWIWVTGAAALLVRAALSRGSEGPKVGRSEGRKV